MASKKRASPSKAKGGVVGQQALLDAMHQVWLAGMGAVSRAQRGAPKVLEELVKEGARLHKQARGTARRLIKGGLGEMPGAIGSRIGGMREQAADAYESLEKIFQARVHRALTQLGVPSAETVAALSKRVDALNTNIEKLIRGPARRTRSRPRAVRRRTRARRAA
jgi:poly(hydroxyalkanoate) granule-associated protein